MNITVTVDDKEIIKSQVKIQKIQKYEEDLQNLEVLLQKEQVRAKEAEQYVEDLKSQVTTNKERISQLEKELKNLQKNHKNLQNKNYELKQFGYLSANGLKEAHQEIEELKKFRMTTLASMSRVVDEKQVLGQKKQARKDKSDMIKEMAAGDMQDADLIRLKKFLSVQMFLKTLLKGKIEKLKGFYEPYELAFLKKL